MILPPSSKITIRRFDHRGTMRQAEEVEQLLGQIDAIAKASSHQAFFVEVTDRFERELGARLSGILKVRARHLVMSRTLIWVTDLKMPYLIFYPQQVIPPLRQRHWVRLQHNYKR